MHRHQSYFLRAASTGLLNAAASALSVALLLPPLILRIGLDAYGFWSMLTLFVGLAALLDLGLSKAIVYLLASGDRPSDELMSAALLVGVGIALSVVLPIVALARLEIPLFGPAVAATPGLAIWIACCGGSILVACVLTTLLRSLLEAKFRLDVVNIGFAAQTLLNYGVALILATVTRDPRVLMLGTAVIYQLLFLAHIFAVAKIAAFKITSVTKRDCKALFGAGLGAYAAELPAVLLAPAVQYLLSLQSRSASNYGIFDLALRIATLCGTALSSLSGPYFAIISATRAEARTDVRRSVSHHLRITLAVAFAGWIAFMLTGKSVLVLLLRQPANELYQITLMMLAGTALLAALEPISRMLLGLGRRGALLTNRMAMLLSALMVAALLTNVSTLERFAIAYTVGLAFAATGLAILNYRESWGRNLHSIEP